MRAENYRMRTNTGPNTVINTSTERWILIDGPLRKMQFRNVETYVSSGVDLSE